jgi:hypothetical protein
MLNVEGRQAKTIDDAKAFIRKFIYEIIHTKDQSGYVKHYEMDLYLPMMMDWILNVPAAKDMEFTTSEVLEVLYMDAAWGLCMDGIFRPGPRSTVGEVPGDSYGKGYSLTAKGKEWLEQERPKSSGDAAQQESRP